MSAFSLLQSVLCKLSTHGIQFREVKAELNSFALQSEVERSGTKLCKARLFFHQYKNSRAIVNFAINKLGSCNYAFSNLLRLLQKYEKSN